MKPNVKMYDLSNVVGILLTSFGAGWLNVGAGFIVAGLMVVAINIYNIKLMKDK